jgi:hypothetical protein
VAQLRRAVTVLDRMIDNQPLISLEPGLGLRCANKSSSFFGLSMTAPDARLANATPPIKFHEMAPSLALINGAVKRTRQCLLNVSSTST